MSPQFLLASPVARVSTHQPEKAKNGVTMFGECFGGSPDIIRAVVLLTPKAPQFRDSGICGRGETQPSIPQFSHRTCDNVAGVGIRVCDNLMSNK